MIILIIIVTITITITTTAINIAIEVIITIVIIIPQADTFLHFFPTRIRIISCWIHCLHMLWYLCSQPEGNLFEDRFKSLQRRNIVEASPPDSVKWVNRVELWATIVSFYKLLVVVVQLLNFSFLVVSLLLTCLFYLNVLCKRNLSCTCIKCYT